MVEWRFAIKKLFLCTVAASFLFTACTLPGAGDPGITLINTEAPSTGVGFTVYLDDNTPPGDQYSRALNLNMAQMDYDFFEVVFKYNDTIARTSWELGQATGVRGVYRPDGPGIDYSSTNPTPVAGTGSAILFVGFNDGKTLLAVGKLTHVDGVETARITSDSASVTFTLSALTAAVSLVAAESSFGLVAPASTVIREILIGSAGSPRTFPWYVLPVEQPSVRGSYTFGLHGSELFEAYRPAILLADSISIITSVPTYTAANGIQYYTNWGELDVNTGIELGNNGTTGVAFQNPVLFDFDTTTTDIKVNTVFSFVFSVPVYALTGAIVTGVAEPTTWYIQPGYGPNWRDLDTGSGSGGAVLVGAYNGAWDDD